MNVFQNSNRLTELANLTKQNNEVKPDSLKLTKEIQELKQKSNNLKSKRDKSLSIRISQEIFKQSKNLRKKW
jgi:hypothetical protein